MDQLISLFQAAVVFGTVIMFGCVGEICTEKAGILNMVALLAIGGVIAWAVMGTFEMQDQITSNMG